MRSGSGQSRIGSLLTCRMEHLSKLISFPISCSNVISKSRDKDSGGPKTFCLLYNIYKEGCIEGYRKGEFWTRPPIGKLR